MVTLTYTILRARTV